jgi:hypothetical protein
MIGLGNRRLGGLLRSGAPRVGDDRLRANFLNGAESGGRVSANISYWLGDAQKTQERQASARFKGERPSRAQRRRINI